MTTPLQSSGAKAFKDKFTSLIPTIINDSTVLVSFGHPGLQDAGDIIGTGKVTASQDVATMSTNRSREEVLTLEVTVSCYRGGGPEMEQVCSDRAYDLLGLIEAYFRATDPTVGGTVRDCFLTSHESNGSTDAETLAEGRLIEITATFTAHVRIGSTYL